MKLAPLLLCVTIIALAQQPVTGPARTSGMCSLANTGTVTTATLNCTGLTPQQQQLLTSVPALLNKLLASQADSTSEILSKLDACIAQGASRHVTKEQADFLDASMQQYAGQKLRIQIYTMTKESNDFGREVSGALKHAGLTIENMPILSISAPTTGFFITLGSNRTEFAQALAKALVDSGIAPPGRIPGRPDDKNPDLLELIVGFKP